MLYSIQDDYTTEIKFSQLKCDCMNRNRYIESMYLDNCTSKSVFLHTSKSVFLRLLRLHKLLISKLAHRKDSSTQLSSTNWQLLSSFAWKFIFVTLRSTRWIFGQLTSLSNWSNLSQCAAFGTYLFSLYSLKNKNGYKKMYPLKYL